MSEAPHNQTFTSPRTGTGWRAVRVIAAMIGMPAAVFIGFAPTFVLRPLISDPTMELQFVIFTLLALFTAGCYIAVTWLLAHFIDRSTLVRCGLVFHQRDLIALLAGTIGMSVLVVPTGLILRSLQLAPVSEDAGGLPLWVTLTQGLLLAFVFQGFGEEFLWRGYLLRHLQLNLRPAIWVSAAAFGVMHLISNGGQQDALDYLLYLATPFGFAMLAGAMAARLGSIWAAVGVHGGSHVAHLILTLLGVGDASRGMWLGEGLVCLLVALFVMRGLPQIPAAALQTNLPAKRLSQ